MALSSKAPLRTTVVRLPSVRITVRGLMVGVALIAVVMGVTCEVRRLGRLSREYHRKAVAFPPGKSGCGVRQFQGEWRPRRRPGAFGRLTDEGFGYWPNAVDPGGVESLTGSRGSAGGRGPLFQTGTEVRARGAPPVGTRLTRPARAEPDVRSGAVRAAERALTARGTLVRSRRAVTGPTSHDLTRLNYVVHPPSHLPVAAARMICDCGSYGEPSV